MMELWLYAIVTKYNLSFQSKKGFGNTDHANV
jgi:hypothetical protein